MTQTTTCCIAGGGPAGVMLGFLLARAGVDVVVLEKHADFLRDFRGDTVHPSTLEVLHELGLLDAFLQRPHQELRELAGIVGGQRVRMADFSRLPTRCRFIALMPQWDFLDFLAGAAAQYPGFKLLRNARVDALVRDGDRIAGVTAETPGGPITVHADLVVAADGRHSAVRAAAGLEPRELGAPIDVLWLRVPREPGDPRDAFGHVEAGRMLVMIDRGDYWQCALVVSKGSIDEVRARGLPALRETVLGMSPWLGSRVDAIRTWDDVKLLSVAVDRLERWWLPGLLCIGDAAHAMSPIGGVGINLAVQDAVATANILAAPLRERRADAELRQVQQRREWPAKATQWVQVAVQNRVIGPILASTETPTPPAALKLFNRWPALPRLFARGVGMGVRPEHVRA